MSSKGLALVVSVVVLSACGAAQPEGRPTQPGPMVAESSTTSSDVELTATTTTSLTPMTVAEPGPAQAEHAGSVLSATSTTAVAGSPTSTTTNPTESIDFAEVQEALDALDALFGDLDRHIGSVDLDEGEAP